MAEQLMLMKHPMCGYCKILEERIKDKIEAGTIGIIDASTQEGLEIAKSLGIRGVPDCVKKKEDGTYEKCGLEDLLKA